MDNETLKKAQRIANKARKSISDYCMNECGSFCCRKGFIVITPREINKVTKKRTDELLKKEILKKLSNGNYSLYMGNYDTPCPCFIDGKCSIHKSSLRPKVCGEFPLFVQDGYVRASPRCPAVKEGKLYPYIRQLIDLGFKIMESDPYGEIDLYKVDLIEE